MHVLGQHNPGVDLEWHQLARPSHCLAQQADTIDEQRS
jgi:hypothetical protein